jgi:hypothetical protein
MCRKIPKREWITTKKPGCTIAVFALCAAFFSSGAVGARVEASDVPGAGSCTVNFNGTGVTLSGAHLVNGVSVTVSGGTYSSTTSDQNVFLVVNGGNLTIDGAAITKTGGPVGEVDDAYNFYGLNSIVVVVGDGSTARITNCTLDADSNGSNAIVAANGGAVTVNGVTITTSGGSSRGLHATYGGTITAENVDITTSGAHSAPLATDRGGGTVTVSGVSTVSAAGEGSPCIYSTGSITATGLTGTSTGSEIAVIEGFNSITLDGCTLTGKQGNGVMLYQSGSGDAANGTSTFACANSLLTSEASGAMFYTTNTECAVSVTNSTLNNSGAALIEAAADRWGTSGANGGRITLTATSQPLVGDLACDGVSSIVLNVGAGSTWTGQKTGTTANITVNYDTDPTVTPTAAPTAAATTTPTGSAAAGGGGGGCNAGASALLFPILLSPLCFRKYR